MTFWPFWLGAIGLATVASLYLALTRRPLGVSGFMTPGSGNVPFLVGIVSGAVIAAVTSGAFHVTFDPGADFARIVANVPMAYPALLGGGVLVGFGTSMAGGCTSGHGLVGCARLQPGSLLSTACFFGVAILVSFFLERM